MHIARNRPAGHQRGKQKQNKTAAVAAKAFEAKPPAFAPSLAVPLPCINEPLALKRAPATALPKAAKTKTKPKAQKRAAPSAAKRVRTKAAVQQPAAEKAILRPLHDPGPIATLEPMPSPQHHAVLPRGASITAYRKAGPLEFSCLLAPRERAFAHWPAHQSAQAACAVGSTGRN